MPAQDELEVVVGYLITFPDGYITRLPLDDTRDRAYAERYAMQQHAICEPMYVRRRQPAVQWPTPTVPRGKP